jgi:hypothetical protein
MATLETSERTIRELTEIGKMIERKYGGSWEPADVINWLLGFTAVHDKDIDRIVFPR